MRETAREGRMDGETKRGREGGREGVEERKKDST